MTDVYPGTLRGYRIWYINSQDNLKSCTYGYGGGRYIWQPGENRAECSAKQIRYFRPPYGVPCLRAPSQDCQCGFYATLYWNPCSCHLSGVIEAWGRIELHDRGFRAEKAKVVALYWEHGNPPRSVYKAIAIAKVYQVPLFTNSDRLLDAYPLVQIDDLVTKP